jgi:PAS domain-containing protein
MFSALFAVFLLGRKNVFSNPLPSVRPSLSGNSDKTIFVFKGSRLVNATPAALIYVGAPVDRNAVWTKLLGKLENSFANASKHLQALADLGQEFEQPGENNRMLAGQMRIGKLEIEIVQQPINHAPAAVEKHAIAAQFDELLFLREVCDRSPNLVWQVAKDGSVQWANQAYLDLLGKLYPEQTASTPPYRLVLQPSDMDRKTARRQSLLLPGLEVPQWFETSSLTQNDGNVLNFAFRADHVIQAEKALRNFVQTLTKTFAHLPIGLAIFDRNRQLALFNPALADLTTLEPTWLTARPTLTAFLDCLRENLHVPEPKNYKTWRDRIQALERAAEDGTYEENWPLPTGQTFRVTGRPHPEGAVAFLFEDITSAISLQREFRSELDLGQSVLDSQPGAVAVFAANGDLVMSNDGFLDLWGIDPREMLSRLSVVEATEIWRKACAPSDVWAELGKYAKRSTDRAAWGGQLSLHSGARLNLAVKPLVQGAFICEFTTASNGRAHKKQANLADA